MCSGEEKGVCGEGRGGRCVIRGEEEGKYIGEEEGCVWWR